jgi:23S rRNA pseudouridine2605 synthase
MIADRRIALDGKPLETPATILTSLKGVTVDGKPVNPAAETRLFLFHKPSGFITAERDFSGRPTIYDRLPKDLPRLMPVGRLDLNTEGLLLSPMTASSSGSWNCRDRRRARLPRQGVRGRDAGAARGSDPGRRDRRDPLRPDRRQYGAQDGAELLGGNAPQGGKNREVRRVLEHLGLQVSRLIRVAYGPFILGDLPLEESARSRKTAWSTSGRC